MRTLLQYFEKAGIKKSHLILLFILEVSLAMILVLVSEALRRGVRAIETLNQQALVQIFIFAIFLTLAQIILDALAKLFWIKEENAGAKHIQLELLNHLLEVRREGLDTIDRSEVVTTVMSHASRATEASLYALKALYSGTWGILFTAIYMLWIEWRLALCLIVYVALLQVLLSCLHRTLRAFNKEKVRVEKNNNHFMLDLLHHMLTVRVFDQNNFFTDAMHRREKTALKATMKARFLENGIGEICWSFLKLAEFFLIYGLGAVFIYRKLTDPGTLLALCFAVDFFMKSIRKIVDFQVVKNEAVVRIEAIDKMFELGPSEAEAVELCPPCVGEKNVDRLPLPDKTFGIRLENLSFSYPDGKLVLQNVNMEILPGEKVLLKGPNGMGKSTLLKLISGLYRPDSGHLFFNQCDTSTFSLKELSQCYTLINQESILFPGTVEENIAMSRQYDAHKIQSVLKQLNLDNFFETVESLSAGEKQRINIGRFLYDTKKPLVLLDEVFSHIDEKNHFEILNALLDALEGKTSIWIAHDADAKDFDRVFTVDGGKVIEEVSNEPVF